MLGICAFSMGESNTWISEKLLGKTNSENECAVLVQKLKPSANGATWGDPNAPGRSLKEASGNKCYAQFNMTDIYNSDDFKMWRTCGFDSKIYFYFILK